MPAKNDNYKLRVKQIDEKIAKFLEGDEKFRLYFETVDAISDPMKSLKFNYDSKSNSKNLSLVLLTAC